MRNKPCKLITNQNHTDYILGMAKMGKGVRLLLDIDRVLGAEGIEQLKIAA